VTCWRGVMSRVRPFRSLDEIATFQSSSRSSLIDAFRIQAKSFHGGIVLVKLRSVCAQIMPLSWRVNALRRAELTKPRNRRDHKTIAGDAGSATIRRKEGLRAIRIMLPLEQLAMKGWRLNLEHPSGRGGSDSRVRLRKPARRCCLASVDARTAILLGVSGYPA